MQKAARLRSITRLRGRVRSAELDEARTGLGLARRRIPDVGLLGRALALDAVDPAAVPDALAGAHVFVLPSKSENFGHAFIEAMSAGRPVITSDFTPWNGLKEKMAGINTATNAGAILKSINFFAGMDAHELNRWSAGAASFSRSAINLSSLSKQYDELFEKNALPI